MHVWVVLPAFNEEDGLPAIFEGLRRLRDATYKLSVTVIVVDDGSTDATATVARTTAGDLPVQVIENGVNQGLAVTFMRGMMSAAEQAGDNDIVVCMDADNTHLPGQIAALTRSIEEGRDVVVASRYQRGAVVRGVPFFRRILSRVLSLLFRIVYPIPGVQDYSCGYRAYRAGFLRRAIANQGQRLFATEGFACMVGLLLRLDKHGAICGEIPLVLRYDQKEGASKMQIGRTVLKTLGVLIRERLSSN